MYSGKECMVCRSLHLLVSIRDLKADFQFVLRSLSALMFVSLTNIRGKSMLFVTNCLPYLWGAFKLFPQQFPCVLQLWSFFSSSPVISERMKHKASHRKMAVDMKLWIYVMYVDAKCFILWRLTWDKTKVVNKLSRVYRTDWKSASRYEDGKARTGTAVDAGNLRGSRRSKQNA